MSEERFRREVAAGARRIERQRGRPHSFWQHASSVGVGGWVFVIPVVGGAYLGRWLDRHAAGQISWTITCIVLGVALGTYNLWHFTQRRGGG